MKYKNQSILSKVGYNAERNISTSFASNNISNSLEFNPINPFNSFDNFEYDEVDPMTKLIDTTHSYVPTIHQKIANFNTFYAANSQDIRLETICNSILDEMYSMFGFKLGLDIDNNVKLLHYILNNGLNIIGFLIAAMANEIIKTLVRNTNSIHKLEEKPKLNHTYKIVFNTLQSNSKSTNFIKAYNAIIKSDKNTVRSAIIAKLKTKNNTILIFSENDIGVICKTLTSIFEIDIEELHQELLYVALGKVEKV